MTAVAVPLKVELLDLPAKAVMSNPSDKALASESLVYVCQEAHPLMDVAVDKANAHRLKDQLVL